MYKSSFKAETVCTRFGTMLYLVPTQGARDLAKWAPRGEPLEKHKLK
jgi:hypothetical protein